VCCGFLSTKPARVKTTASLRNWTVKICKIPLKLIASIAPPPPLLCPFSGPGKILHYTNITEPHTGGIFHSTFIIIPVAFFKEIKGTVSQDFSKLTIAFFLIKI
jgi:hypothetical protein